MNDERAALLAAIDAKIRTLRARERAELGNEAAYARRCFEAFRSEVENGLHLL